MPGVSVDLAFDAGPLIRWLDRHNHSWNDYHLDTVRADRANVADVIGLHRLTMVRWRQGARLNAWQVDRFCTRAGIHPAEIYGQEWWDKTELAVRRAQKAGRLPRDDEEIRQCS